MAVKSLVRIRARALLQSYALMLFRLFAALRFCLRAFRRCVVPKYHHKAHTQRELLSSLSLPRADSVTSSHLYETDHISCTHKYQRARSMNFHLALVNALDSYCDYWLLVVCFSSGTYKLR